ncbi:class I SAM-dependent methyltransferase [Acidihalobacter prosperus]|uniref:Methyltransferase type 12 n=1 Tax=Acidihalobacter prosperus TaxID=160660 RepID=A0A1A6C6B9_9GAMM|nr:class I SAM-dependent methyltransferase [Acidihalobacter prosperus]OBS10108.1 methyltransferase type 12 [Acidihalobacter prosperus]
MNLRDDARVLWTLLRGQPGGATHAERLDRFYGPQASRYDGFRERLLHGRDDLLSAVAAQLPAAGGRLIELGAGTGRNLGYLSGRVDSLEVAELVDVCAPLLAQARRRWAGHDQVRVREADATRYRPERPMDAAYFAYALTMIPDWFEAVDNALRLLKPGGVLGVVDFYVSRPHPAPGLVRHGALARHFWPAWFGHDGVRPSPDHLPYLMGRLDVLRIEERRAPVPYLPGLRVPYYLFVGRKPG